MSHITIETSDEVDVGMIQIARLLEIDTTDLALMRKAILEKALGLLQFLVNEQKTGSKIFVENRGWNHRKKIEKI